MSYYAVIRGPLGIGKTTVSQRVATRVGARYVSIDRILDHHGIWVSGRLSEFLRANLIAAEQANGSLAKGIPVIFDGNFYWKGQITDIVRRLDYDHQIFTLSAPLAECIARDSKRKPSHGARAAREVFAKSTAFACGVRIDADRPVAAVVRDIVSRLPPASDRAIGSRAHPIPISTAQPSRGHVAESRAG